MARIGVIGAGRVGAVLSATLRRAGHDIVAAAGETDASRFRIETLLPGVPRLKPSAVARASDVLLLTVPDDALSNVVTMLSASGAIREGMSVVHTSGAHGSAVLRPAAERGAHVAAMHPAMTFTGTDIDLARLSGCVFGCTAPEDPPARALVDDLVADLGGRSFWIEEQHRVLYHAALAHGANHLVTLVSQSMELLRRSGVTDPAATLQPLLQAALDNSLSYGDAALTGPIVRGDLKTVRAHLGTLQETSLETLESYIAMARATANHAVLDGRLQPARAAVIVEALNDARVKAIR
ncbi:MAG: DUF2520 domain-containing protein [Propionibacteriales bacterium]|nr:DUF2520 domain-containing protein [Propionibacteriales bacterium]